MAGSTVSGIGSNIDTQAIVTSLVNAEKAPKQAQINTQTGKATTTLSSLGTIQVALDAFRAALDTMTASSSFTGLSGTSSDEKVATMTASKTASSGSFRLIVEQLAQPSKLSSKTFASGASAVVNATDKPTTLTISQSGKKFDVSIPAGATLQQVRDSINTQFGTAGMSANILTDSTGSRLILTSTTMGVGSDLTLSGNSGLDVGATVVDDPKDAKYSIDGIAATSKTNSITGALSGVDIKLVSVSALKTAGDTSTDAPRTATLITVSTNTAALKTGVKGFVDAYNTLITAMNAQTKVTTNLDGSTTAAALTGDSTMRSLQSAIRNEFNALSGTGSFKALAQFGVATSSTTGLLSIDDKKWDAAVKTNAADINSMFTGTTGMLARMKTATEPYAKASTGIFATRSATLSESLKDLTKQQTSLDARMETLQNSLSAKYNAMDTLVAQLRQQSTSVMTTLNALNNPKTNT
ncbi:flagellar filament capping protein FliD [Pseudomonas fluorescens]|uniref:flagellar filament capping protein FliD n=1 Tax=Pseudomonas fluorescens TaxID=294 RepID=UPI001786C68E|nr:flagellar filament capping protein FliD [Pseudomonas fluorescens]MBD8190809.1 flagellar filament capping protein FliD [Pseudomonas fluorescens]MBD8225435.1 flagellar filament capping protein FliD [Pseudomonas fluorescens]MBD8237180.1 flagellar filament capping protein FliD [Pseudomonas fluorescens]MBD8786141.1 flagellar filament capping protein FliD [Pseudomonas fluorescens]MBD8815980.1 flagellar filament capping protein FliD [Pseudomonas fluorescens]